MRVPKTHAVPPTRGRFLRLVNHLRNVENHDAADFVELVAYSGMRVRFSSAGEVDFLAGRLMVTGGALITCPEVLSAAFAGTTGARVVRWFWRVDY